MTFAFALSTTSLPRIPPAIRPAYLRQDLLVRDEEADRKDEALEGVLDQLRQILQNCKINPVFAQLVMEWMGVGRE